ncbi:diguanylate cyclase [Salinisphaera hydrothermalis C41B8]|uniref:diguanylate cyclase n=1 Tax=Salinisphaera hydrothermalis (strain C41B8) TaxID=1304275 RepID=A0A084IN85_SALHC|nr:diguanylate cyclase [Salinisphaera hydrothermalis C41B8]
MMALRHNALTGVESALRRVSVGRRTIAVLVLLLLPLGVLSIVSVAVLDAQQSAFRESVQESIDTLMPLTTLEYYLQSARIDGLEAETGQPESNTQTLAARIDTTFARMGRAEANPDLSAHLVESARTAWDKARPAVEHLVTQPHTLSGETPRLAPSEQELARSIDDIQQARAQLTQAIKSRYERAEHERHAQIVRLIWAWAATLLFAIVLIGVFVYSLLRPVRALNRVAERLESGEFGARAPTVGNDELTRLSQRFNAMVESWEHTQRDLLTQAEYDALTHVLNRRGIRSVLDIELANHRQRGHPLSVLVLDLDRFKPINDTYGHGAGDRALVWIAEQITQTLRKTDHLGRYGGDEFLAVLPNTCKTEAIRLAERLTQAIDRAARGRPTLPALSVGTASLSEDGATADELVEAADAVLYRHKQWRREQRGARA